MEKKSSRTDCLGGIKRRIFLLFLAGSSVVASCPATGTAAPLKHAVPVEARSGQVGGSCGPHGAFPAGAQRTPELAIRLRIHDRANVPIDVLERAMARTADTYRRAGVRTEWTKAEPACDDGIPLMDVVIVADDGGDHRKASRAIDGIAGRAHPAANRVYVFYTLIRNAAAAYKVPQAAMLGDVISHELGHILLTPRSHSASGIMRPDILTRGPARAFEPPERKAMERRLLGDDVGRTPVLNPRQCRDIGPASSVGIRCPESP